MRARFHSAQMERQEYGLAMRCAVSFETVAPSLWLNSQMPTLKAAREVLERKVLDSGVLERHRRPRAGPTTGSSVGGTGSRVGMLEESEGEGQRSSSCAEQQRQGPDQSDGDQDVGQDAPCLSQPGVHGR